MMSRMSSMSSEQNDLPIGIFDSGLGGLTEAGDFYAAELAAGDFDGDRSRTRACIMTIDMS